MTTNKFNLGDTVYINGNEPRTVRQIAYLKDGIDSVEYVLDDGQAYNEILISKHKQFKTMENVFYELLTKSSYTSEQAVDNIKSMEKRGIISFNLPLGKEN